MSGCHNSEHYKPSTLECSLCNAESRINQLEESYKGACKDIEFLCKELMTLANKVSILIINSEQYNKKIMELQRFQDITHEQYKFNISKETHECPLCSKSKPNFKTNWS